MKAKTILEKYNACSSAIDWVGDRTVEEAWVDCHRGDWMFWIFSKMYPENIHDLTLVNGHCAATVQHLMKDERSVAAVKAAIDFGERKISEEELEKFADGAYSAYYTYLSNFYIEDFGSKNAAYAAWVATLTTNAVSAAGWSAASASSEAFSEVTKAEGFNALSRYEKFNQQQTADICRKYLLI